MSTERTYTKEQEVIVERILKHPHHEYYRILEVERTASDTEIKKAYRKVSLKVHPDKNSHPKAAESFKRVAKAFEILGDPQKRRLFDQTGTDPDSRGGRGGASANSAFSSGASPFMNFQGGSPFGGFQFDGNEDLFDILFGGGQGGTTFTFGGPSGVRFSTMGGGSPFGGPHFGRRGGPRGRAGANAHPRQHAQQGDEPNMTLLQTLKQLLPIFAVLLLPMISNIFSSVTSQQNYNLEKIPPFTQLRYSQRLQVPYYITKKQEKEWTPRKIGKLDSEIEGVFVKELRYRCSSESNERDRKIDEAYGWFFTDEGKLLEAQQMKMPHCEKLLSLGLI